MAFKKRTSPILEKAQQRAAALTSIDPELNLGSGLTLSAYNAKIADMHSRLDGYNTVLSTVDGMANALGAGENELGDLNERMLMGVAVKYGKDSVEYEMAGGRRKSERRRPARKPPPPSA